MAKTKTTTNGNNKPMRPATNPEARENQLIALAVDLVEQRLLDGTASSQETTHFLKLGSTKNKLEMEKMRLENELTKAKTEQVESQKQSQKLFEEAIAAFKRYGGHGSSDDY